MEPIEQEAPPFVAPDVLLGDTVLWQHTPGDGYEYAAVVTRVGVGGSIAVSILTPEMSEPIRKEAVLHSDDPLRGDKHDPDNGTWHHTERTLRTLRLEAAVEAIQEFLADESDEDETEDEAEGDEPQA